MDLGNNLFFISFKTQRQRTCEGRCISIIIFLFYMLKICIVNYYNTWSILANRRPSSLVFLRVVGCSQVCAEKYNRQDKNSN